MSLTAVTITGTFERADGTIPQGTVIATLSETIQNGTETVEPTPILGTLDTEGKLASQALTTFVLVANDDTGTTPAGSTYSFVIKLDNAPVREFEATIHHAAVKGEVSIAELEAQ